jgi:hypothetical protein
MVTELYFNTGEIIDDENSRKTTDSDENPIFDMIF